MRCIYCNSEKNLTSSDIITYAITGAKVAKHFVCYEHNAFTNENYEKKFVADLDFIRYNLGFYTRDGNQIKYTADISVDGNEIHNVKISNRESLYAPKKIVAGYDDKGNKILMAPMKKLEKISKGRASEVDISNVTLHKTLSSDSFLGFYAVHSIAKIAYEWFCYINKIEAFETDYKEIVDYILGKTDEDLVDIIIDQDYYFAIDQLSEIGTNTLFQYDDLDGYRYVIFDFWKSIAYRVRICRSPANTTIDTAQLIFHPYLYHIDGTKSDTVFGSFFLNRDRELIFTTIAPNDITDNLWKFFVKRIEKLLSTMVLSIHILKREIDLLSSKLKEYDEGKIDVMLLLGFEENNIITTIEIINHLRINKDKYDSSKSFNQNLSIILNVSENTISRTPEEKKNFVKKLINLDQRKELSNYIWQGISVFNEIYEHEMMQ